MPIGDMPIGDPVAATDPDGTDDANPDTDGAQSLMYSLGDTADDDSFAIDSDTGQLKTKDDLDYEDAANPDHSYEVTITVSDGNTAYDDTITVTITVTDVNEAPVFTEGDTAARMVAENTVAGGDVGDPLTVTDPDTADELTYDISEGNIAGLFEIDEMGQLTTTEAAVPANTYVLTVTVSDGKASDGTDNPAVDATIMVTITVGNTAPTFDATAITRSISPDTPMDSPVGSPVTAMDHESDPLTYDISSGDTDGLFAIDDMGQLTTAKAVPAGTYELMVTVSDGKAADGTPDTAPDATITVTITVENTAPAFDATAPITRSISPDTPMDSPVGDPVTAMDRESDPLTYDISSGDTDGLFAIDDMGQLTTAKAVPAGTYELMVTVSDGKAADGTPDTAPDAEIMVTIEVTANRAPAFASATATRSIPEDTAVGGNVGAAVTATDADNDDLMYSLDDTSDASFSIDSEGQLTTDVALDAATQNSYTVMVSVTDNKNEAGGSDDTSDATITVTVTVTPVDETQNRAPAFASATTTRSIPEDTAVGGNVGAAVTATDADNDDLMYSLDDTSDASFSIDSEGQLTTDVALDAATQNSYTVMVSVTDNKNEAGGSDDTSDATITVTVTVTPVDETQNRAPVFASATTTRSIPEGASGRTVDSPVTATDPDTGDTLTYAITGGDTTFFDIDMATGQLTTKALVTARTYSVTVTVTDGGTPSESATIQVSITVTAVSTGGRGDGGTGDVPAPQPIPVQPPPTIENDPPTFAAASTTRTVAENSAAGTNIGDPVTATDANNDPVTYVLGGTDVGSFSIDAGTGQLQTSAALDFETKSSYTVTVTANDGQGGTASITVTISVTDVPVSEGDPVPTNTAPAFASATATRSVAENTAAGGNIGAAVAATDSDAGDVLTYTLGGTDMASFDINGATGQLMTQAMLDHETKASYTVMVTATDTAGLTDSITVTITVTNVNEAPMFADETATRMVDENTAADMMIGDAFMATDLDDGDEVMYSLGGDDMESFAIDAATGQLMTMAMLDHETKDSYMVMVTATDEAGLTGSIMVTISVTDVNDAPMFASATAERMVEENTAADMMIGDPLTAMDDDGDDVTYSLGGDDMGSFAIDDATGQLMTMAELDHETKASHTVMVTASDGTDMSSITVTIMVTDVPEFMLTVPAGQSLIHIPLKMAGLAKISDLYDKLGGAANVNLLITYDPMGERWLSYLGDRNKGQTPDKDLTDDLGILAVMKEEVTVQLSGDPLGTDGTASIMLQAGTNLVGVPLKDSRITNVSDLLELDGIKDNVSYIIVSDGFKTITRAGDPGDVAVTGGQSFILQATEAATVMITGDGWASSAATAAPSWISRMGIQKDGVTAALAVTGSIVDDVKGLTDFHITVKNLSTGKVDTVATSDDGVGYQLTFVDIETGRAAQIGDHLEITARSADPLVGVEPLRRVVTAEDVKRGHIQLDTLVTYEIPAKTELLRNYPNPFNPETWIPYRLAKDATVTLEIYDTTGGIVRNIHIGHQIAAIYESRSKAIYWDGRNNLGERVASGIYFYHLSAGDYSAARKMVILK